MVANKNNTECENVTHCQTGKARYDDLVTWTDSGEEVDHSVNNWVDDRVEFGVVVDVESNADIPQRPILAIAYDEYTNEVHVAIDTEKYSIPHIKNEFGAAIRQEFEEQGHDVSEVLFTFHTGVSWFGEILDGIHDFNRAHDDKKKSLVVHNSIYDLGILGKANDELLGDKFDADEYDGVISYKDWSVGHYKAGANGRIYSFRKNLVPIKINVIDTMTVADAIYKPSNLEGLCEAYGVRYHEDENQEHGVINEQYVRYNANDVAATLDVKNELEKTLQENFSFNKSLSKIYSSASIAKQKLRDLGYDRTHYTERASKIVASSYFGGQTEALSTGRIIQDVAYTDILSQYPTASALTGVWDYMKAERVRIEEVPETDLPKPSLTDLQSPGVWSDISDYYVAVEARNAKLPVRASLDSTDTTRVYKANVTHDKPVMYHYMDVVGALLYGEGEVDVKAAFKTVHEGKHPGLTTDKPRETVIGGTKITSEENLMRRGIEERKRVQYEVNDGEKDDRTLSLKVVANSIYGVTAERIVESESVNGEVHKHDVAGTFYNPHVAASVTAAGRLMLSLGEVVANENGGDLHYCDTDSLIIDNDVSTEVIDAFSDLNPYSGVAGELDVLEIEEENGVVLQGVDLFAVDVKKYAILKDGKIVMNKEHGLGHYEQFRSDRVKRFWGEVIYRTTDALGEGAKVLRSEELSEPVWWQTQATTAVVRERMEDLHDTTVRYGDFMKRSVNNLDGLKQYLGLGDTYIEVDHTDRRTRFDNDEESVYAGTKVLTRDEKRSLEKTTSFTWKKHGLAAMQAKAALINQGATEWVNHYEPGMGYVDAVKHFENAKQSARGPVGVKRSDAQSISDHGVALEKAEKHTVKAVLDGVDGASEELVGEYGWSPAYVERIGSEWRTAGEAMNYSSEAKKAKRVRVVEGVEEKDVCKTIGDVVNEWTTMVFASLDGRPSVRVTGTKKVTKEASDLSDAWNKKLLSVLAVL